MSTVRVCNSRELFIPRVRGLCVQAFFKTQTRRLMMKKESKPDCLVLSGGGIRGIALLGSTAALLDAGHLENIHTYVGTSVGAIVAASLALGLHPQAVFEQSVLGHRYEAHIDISNLDSRFGLDDGRGLEEWFAKFVPPTLTFRQWQDQTGGKKSLVIVATNLNTKHAAYLSAETTPDLEILKALRMSCAVPLYFTAVTYEGELYVDGAVSDNFSLDFALEMGARRVLGVRLRAKDKPPHTPWRMESVMGAVVEASFLRRIPKKAEVIDLDAGNSTNPLNFALCDDSKRILYESGTNQTLLYMKKTV